MSDERRLFVLLLDDDPRWLRALGRLVERRDASVVALTSPETLLEKIADRTPDVMVIDFQLGQGQTGADVARIIREHLRDSCPPLLLVSGTLSQVADRDFAPFDAAYSKATGPARLVNFIIEAGTNAKGSRTQPVLRSEQLGELGRERFDDEPSWPNEG